MLAITVFEFLKRRDIGKVPGRLILTLILDLVPSWLVCSNVWGFWNKGTTRGLWFMASASLFLPSTQSCTVRSLVHPTWTSQVLNIPTWISKLCLYSHPNAKRSSHPPSQNQEYIYCDIVYRCHWEMERWIVYTGHESRLGPFEQEFWGS